VNSNSNKTGTSKDSQLEQELKDLKKQYEQLRDKKVRTEQDVANLSTRLEELKSSAQAEYGTSDPEELQALLEKKREQNEKVVSEYREHIQQIQADLADVENTIEGNE